MRTSALVTLLLASALTATAPASANWFSRPDAGISLNVGSAPNPTPNDLRALYGPSRYAATAEPRRYTVTELHDMAGKTVYGENGEQLGVILAVEDEARLVDMHMPGGLGVTIHAELLVNERDRVIAPTLSRAEVTALAQEQIGRAMAANR
jgi:hypothetical protein